LLSKPSPRASSFTLPLQPAVPAIRWAMERMELALEPPAAKPAKEVE
jgi:hypothetical protein